MYYLSGSIGEDFYTEFYCELYFYMSLVLFTLYFIVLCSHVKLALSFFSNSVFFFLFRLFSSDLNEASLLWNLKIRYDKEMIYVSDVYLHFSLYYSLTFFIFLPTVTSTCWVINFSCPYLPVSYLISSVPPSLTDLHGEHPCGCQSVPYVRYLRVRHGEEVRGTDTGHVTPVSIVINRQYFLTFDWFSFSNTSMVYFNVSKLL